MIGTNLNVLYLRIRVLSRSYHLFDEVLTEITERMEAAMRGAVEELMEETLAARAEIVREEFGEWK